MAVERPPENDPRDDSVESSRRIVRFSLRSLFVFVALVCLLLTFPGYFLRVAMLFGGVLLALLMWVCLVQWPITRWSHRRTEREKFEHTAGENAAEH